MLLHSYFIADLNYLHYFVGQWLPEAQWIKSLITPRVCDPLANIKLHSGAHFEMMASESVPWGPDQMGTSGQDVTICSFGASVANTASLMTTWHPKVADLVGIGTFSSSIQWAWKKCCGTWISPQQPPALPSIHPLVTTNRRSFIKCKYSHSLSLEKRFKTFPLSFKVNEIFSTAVWRGLFFPTTLTSMPATSSFPPCPVLLARVAFWCLPCVFISMDSPPDSPTLCVMDL